MSFNKFGFHSQIKAGITAAGYTTPTPIQSEAIPKAMQGSDIMGLAQTGTGKTAAFVLPILHRLMQAPPGKGRALIIAPTRELAEQIHASIKSLGRKTRLKSTSVYGGVGIHPQITALRKADIVVACPGRLLDHINRGTVSFSNLEVLVLDEADHMFDMGFLPDIRRILSHLPQKKRQTMLFSATMPQQINRLATDILNQPTKIQIGNTKPAETVSHTFYPVEQHLKAPFLIRLLGESNMGTVLIFTRTKHRARQLSEKLAKAGHRSASLQGNLSQSRRLDAMNGFKSGKYQVLVATDIAARGIDVSNVSHVINFDMPSTPETYIHRIGRTGRAKSKGQAFSLITKDDGHMARVIRKAIGLPIEQRTLKGFNYQAPKAAAASNKRVSRPQLKARTHARSRQRAHQQH